MTVFTRRMAVLAFAIIMMVPPADCMEMDEVRGHELRCYREEIAVR